MKPFRISILVHITGWLLFLSLPLIFLVSQNGYELTAIAGSPTFWLFCLYYIVLFYLHSYVLLPLLFRKNKKGVYILCIATCMASVYMIQPFDRLMSESRRPAAGRMMRPPPAGEFRPLQPGDRGQHPPEGMPGRNGNRHLPVDIVSIILFAITIVLSIAIDLSRRWRITEKRAAQAEADKAQAELAFLKAQINPHFLFNTLNNIYSMAVTHNEHTAGTVLKLSNIMRYVTDEVNQDLVPLQSEIDCISDYIDLQKLRLNKKVSLDYRVTGSADNRLIAPLILMSFVENVFKYGTSSHEPSSLRIQIDILDNSISFYAENTLFPVRERLERRTGIGIENTKKRLVQLYPGKHSLHITQQNGLFMVHLTLNS